MGLFPVTGREVRLSCATCAQRFPSTVMLADHDGSAFAAYVCPTCVPVAAVRDGDHITLVLESYFNNAARRIDEVARSARGRGWEEPLSLLDALRSLACTPHGFSDAGVAVLSARALPGYLPVNRAVLGGGTPAQVCLALAITVQVVDGCAFTEALRARGTPVTMAGALGLLASRQSPPRRDSQLP